MARSSAKSIVLVWASTEEFAGTIGKFLTASALAWEVFHDPEDLEGRDPDSWHCLLMDSSYPGIVEVAQGLRSVEGWESLPVVLIGEQVREELQNDPYVLQIPRPKKSEDLVKVIYPGESRPPLKAPLKRAVYRHSCKSSGTVELGVRIIDVSEAGAQIECPFRVSVGTELQVHFNQLNPGLDRPFKFHVVAVRPCITPKHFYRLHGKFAHLPQDLLRVLRQTLLRVQSVSARFENPQKS